MRMAGTGLSEVTASLNRRKHHFTTNVWDHLLPTRAGPAIWATTPNQYQAVVSQGVSLGKRSASDGAGPVGGVKVWQPQPRDSDTSRKNVQMRVGRFLSRITLSKDYPIHRRTASAAGTRITSPKRAGKLIQKIVFALPTKRAVFWNVAKGAWILGETGEMASLLRK